MVVINVNTKDETIDCLVIGGGPGGLITAVYLARFRRSVRVVDAGTSRLHLIPRTRNVLGFPDGVAGTELLERLQSHADHYGVPREQGRVEKVTAAPDGCFEVEVGYRRLRARKLLLATGARDVEPPIPGLAEGLKGGQVRYCPICDGFETQGQRVAVLGKEEHGLRESLFVAGFENHVTWISLGTQHAVPEADLARLRAADVLLADQAPRAIVCRPGRDVVIEMIDGRTLTFDVIYPALGLIHASGLGTALGAKAQENGQLVVDDHLQTTVPGLYVAGDVASGLNQINVAAGHAAIAATAIHNSLR